MILVGDRQQMHVAVNTLNIGFAVAVLALLGAGVHAASGWFGVLVWAGIWVVVAGALATTVIDFGAVDGARFDDDRPGASKPGLRVARVRDVTRSQLLGRRGEGRSHLQVFSPLSP